MIRPFRPGSLALTVVLVFAAFELAVSQSTIDLGAIKDNTLYEDMFGTVSNGSGEHFFAGRVNLAGSGLIRRGLIAFDIAGSVPAGATITTATLTLNMTRTSSAAQNVDVHRLLKGFGEGPSNAIGQEGSGAVAIAPDATWLHAEMPIPFWSTPGGDYAPTPSASLAVAGIGAYSWSSTSMTGDVQFWLDNPAMDYGWIVIGNESVTHTAKRFASRDNPSAGQRPVLSVSFVLPDTVVIVADLDNTLYEDSTGALSNGVGSHFFAGRTSQIDGSLRRGLVRFDIQAEVPPGATILESSITLFQSKSASELETVTLHTVTSNWGEGTSDAVGAEGIGALSTTGDATWVHSMFFDSLWLAPGGDFTGAPSASLDVDSSLGPHTWTSAGLAADVQEMLDTPGNNFGWMVRANEDSAGTAKRFDTRENASATNRPTLTIISVGGEFPCPVLITGDIDLDQAITSTDIIALVNYVFKSGAAPMPCEAAGDVDCSVTVTSTDIIYMVNHVFKSGPVPCDVCTLIFDSWGCP